MVILGTVYYCFTHITSLFQTHPIYSVCEVGYTLLRSGEPALSSHGGKLVNKDAFGYVPRFLFDVKTYENLSDRGETIRSIGSTNYRNAGTCDIL